MSNNKYHHTNSHEQAPERFFEDTTICLDVAITIKRETHRERIIIDTRDLEALRPIDRCDDAMIAWIVGGANEKNQMEIDKQREQLAKSISDRITDILLSRIKAQDTINGYKQ